MALIRLVYYTKITDHALNYGLVVSKKLVVSTWAMSHLDYEKLNSHPLTIGQPRPAV